MQTQKQARAPKAVSHVQIKIEKARRNRRLFCYASSAADERYFKNKISDWITTPPNQRLTWSSFLFKIVHDRNDGGRDSKYCYFNDHAQRLYLKIDFEHWAAEMAEEIGKVLLKIHS